MRDDVHPARASGPLTPLDHVCNSVQLFMHMEIVAAGIVVRHDRERASAALWSLITLLVWQVLILVPRPIAICVQHVVLPNFFKRRIGAQNLGKNPSTTAPEASCVCSSRVLSLPWSLGGQSRIDKRAKVLHNYTCRATNKDLGPPGIALGAMPYHAKKSQETRGESGLRESQNARSRSTRSQLSTLLHSRGAGGQRCPLEHFCASTPPPVSR